MLADTLKQGPRTIRGKSSRLWRWLGLAAALAVSAASLLVPVTAFGAGTISSISPNPAKVGDTVTISGTGLITGAAAGTVTFTDPAATLTQGTCALTAAGVFTGCTFVIASATSYGAHTIIATSSTSALDIPTIGLTVLTPTTTTMTYPTSGTSVSAGIASVFTATVSPTAATGTVTFKQLTPTGVTICSGTLSSGTVTSSTCTIPANYTTTTVSLQASYGGDSLYGASDSAAITVYTSGGGIGTIIGALSVNGTPNPSSPSQPVIITAQATGTSSNAGCYYLPGTLQFVCPQQNAYATGYMWFQDSSNVQPVCPPSGVTSGGTNNITATCTYTFTTTGAHTVTAYYCPTFPTPIAAGFYVYYQCAGSVAGYTTGTYTQNVNNTVNTTTTLTPSAYSVTAGQNITFTTAVSGSGGTPTGTVTVQENGLTKCTVTLASGSGTCNFALSEGTHTLTAGYAGDGTFLSSNSAPATVTAAAAAGTTIAPTISSGAGAAPILPASLAPPPNTNLAAIRASIGALADIPTADVVFDYFGPSRVVSQLTRPPLLSMPFVAGCYSGPNATAEEQSGSVIFGTKPAGSQFTVFFIRGTRGYSLDIAVGNYCWIDLV